jgi:hypothetical protein
VYYNQLVAVDDGFRFVGFVMSLWSVLSASADFKSTHVRFASRLYGTTLSQAVFYFRSFPDDGKVSKYLVNE